MTRMDLLEEVARVLEVTRKDGYAIVEIIFDSMVRSLRKGEKVEIRGLGSFRTRQRRARLGRNPKTGTQVKVPPKRIPDFTPGKALLELVNSLAEIEVVEPMSV